jgi:hypothetical protein
LLARRLPRARMIGSPAAHAAMINPEVDVAAWLERADYWSARGSPCERGGPRGESGIPGGGPA